MNNKNIAGALLLTLSSFSMSAMAQMSGGDPVRWSVPDTTPQAQYKTSVKEAHAAYGEALKECRQTSATSACKQAAAANLRNDLQEAKLKLSR
jgi:hypothetical protein